MHDELVQRIRDMIVEGQLAPGEKINEGTFTKMFGVSRTPLREALKVLTSENLISHTPNRGFVVTAVTERDVGEVFPVMAVLEGLAGELACSNISPGGLAKVRRLHEEMVSHYEAGNLHDYFRCNQAIHEAILESCGNHTLIQTHRNLAGRVRRARYAANLSRDRWRQAVEEHEEILKALEAREGGRLAKILHDHLLRKMEAVRLRIRSAAQPAAVMEEA